MPFRKQLLATLAMVMSGLGGLYAQEDPDDAVIRVHTVMENYAPEYVLAPEERLRLKSERRELIMNRRAVIDTLDISRRKKRRLLRELYHTPFSDEYREVLSNMLAEEDEEIEDQQPD